MSESKREYGVKAMKGHQLLWLILAVLVILSMVLAFLPPPQA